MDDREYNVSELKIAHIDGMSWDVYVTDDISDYLHCRHNEIMITLPVSSKVACSLLVSIVDDIAKGLRLRPDQTIYVPCIQKTIKVMSVTKYGRTYYVLMFPDTAGRYPDPDNDPDRQFRNLQCFVESRERKENKT